MAQTINLLSPEDLKTYIRIHKEKDYLLINVRQPSEYQDKHAS
jgi:rhodanese-related sulfurtransferase